MPATTDLSYAIGTLWDEANKIRQTLAAYQHPDHRDVDATAYWNLRLASTEAGIAALKAVK